MLDLAWIIPLGPFVAFLLIALGAHRHRALSHCLALAGIAIALILSLGVFWTLAHDPETVHPTSVPWYVMGEERATLGVYLDPTDAVMVVMVSVLCTLITVYSIGYMRGEERYSRFFAYVSLFASAMLGAMVCDNLLAFFVCWEIMGACSYLLIGFYWDRPTAAAAGLKAFIVTKAGDLFLLLGLALLYARVGSLAYSDVLNPETLLGLADLPFLGGTSVATAAALLLFGGTIGKSAQFPLHVWLPDAMEGPTPASALIHAATMVSAGVYLMIRSFPLLSVSQAVPALAVIGTVTALLGAIIALAQNDIKRVLAFSTLSQLGYMVAALGVGAYAAALFHLIVHAFFKALLFMAAGSVIHGVEHGHHRTHGHAVPRGNDDFSPNDMWQMGGLAFRMPLTAVSFLAGSFALSGFPIVTAGFWSKDEILAQAWGANPLVFWGLAVAAGLTAFYSGRQIALTFLGRPRSQAAVYTRENPLLMTAPLLLLSFFAITLGWIGIPDGFPLLGRLVPNWFAAFVEVSLHPVAEGLGELVHVAEAAWQPLATGVVFALGGLGAGLQLYTRGLGGADAQGESVSAASLDPVDRAMRFLRLGWLYRAMANRFYLDDVYRWLLVHPAVWASRISYVLDHDIIDAGVVAVTTGIGQSRIAPAFGFVEDTLVDGIIMRIWRASLRVAGSAAALDTGLLDRSIDFLSATGRLTARLLRSLDSGLVDGVVRGVENALGSAGRGVRRMQTGLLPDYLWNVFMLVLLLVAALVMLLRA